MAGRVGLRRAALAALFAVATGTRAQELGLLPSPRRADAGPFADTASVRESRIDDVGRARPWEPEQGSAFRLGIEAADDTTEGSELGRPAPRQRCVLLQCETLPIEPNSRLFTTGTTLWTAAALFSGFADGYQNPLRYGFQPFHFTDEDYFETWTYAGGADKASHCVVSANVAGLLYDAYALNGLTPDQAFALSLATTVISGALVEIGDAVTPYGFSAQDLTADTVGALAGALVRRGHLDDLIGFQIGKIPTTIPPGVLEGHGEALGFDYSNEIYTVGMKFDGLFDRLHAQPGLGRYFRFSFAFLTKGYGYDPPVPSRYQEVGVEIGLDFPEILKAVGVDDSTWWGDFLLRAFNFFRIPFTQVGAYYNLKNQKWYGPGAPYHYY